MTGKKRYGPPRQQPPRELSPAEAQAEIDRISKALDGRGVKFERQTISAGEVVSVDDTKIVDPSGVAGAGPMPEGERAWAGPLAPFHKPQRERLKMWFEGERDKCPTCGGEWTEADDHHIEAPKRAELVCRNGHRWRVDEDKREVTPIESRIDRDMKRAAAALELGERQEAEAALKLARQAMIEGGGLTAEEADGIIRTVDQNCAGPCKSAPEVWRAVVAALASELDENGEFIRETREGKAVAVSGVWVRKRGLKEAAEVEVLAEVAGAWKRLYSDRLDAFTDGEVSHIIEPAGIRSAKNDDLGSIPPPAPVPIAFPADRSISFEVADVTGRLDVERNVDPRTVKIELAALPDPPAGWDPVRAPAQFSPIADEAPDPPVVVTLTWNCGLGVGAPRWHGTEERSPDECGGAGSIAVPLEDIELDHGKIVNGPPLVFCTACHQGLEESAHFEIDPDEVTRVERVLLAREEERSERQREMDSRDNT